MSQGPANPGFADQARKRTILRFLGFLLLGAGLVVGYRGVRAFLDSADSMSTEDSGFSSILLIAAGGFMVVIALALLNAAFLGAQARYAAGETMPVVKDSASYLTDGQGIANVGRTGATPATGHHCRGCGVRNDADARFCDSCGSALG